jgi:hypothetical protein
MKKYILVCMALFLAISLGACSSDEENNVENDYDELPAWLIPQAKAAAERFKDFMGDFSLLFAIRCATGIHGEKVYHIYNACNSCYMCDLYDENGNNVDYTDVFGERDFRGDEGWIIIFPKKK